MIAAAPDLVAVVAVAAAAAGMFLGLAVGWQSRGHYEVGRRGHDVDMTPRR